MKTPSIIKPITNHIQPPGMTGPGRRRGLLDPGGVGRGGIENPRGRASIMFPGCPLDILLKRADKSKIPNAPTPDYGMLTGRIPMPFQWLRFWNNSKSRQKLSHITFLMYTRKGCHLCDIAWEILRSAQKDHGFVLKAEDVDTDPNLAELYGQIVPVILLNGQVRFRGRINNVLLQRLLKAEIAKSAI